MIDNDEVNLIWLIKRLINILRGKRPDGTEIKRGKNDS